MLTQKQQSRGVLVGQRIEDDSFQGGEYDTGDADGDGEGQDRGGGESGGPPQQTQSMTNVQQQVQDYGGYQSVRGLGRSPGSRRTKR